MDRLSKREPKILHVRCRSQAGIKSPNEEKSRRQFPLLARNVRAFELVLGFAVGFALGIIAATAAILKAMQM